MDLTEIVTARLSAEDAARLRWYCDATGQTVSEVLRDRIRSLPSSVFTLTKAS